LARAPGSSLFDTLPSTCLIVFYDSLNPLQMEFIETESGLLDRTGADGEREVIMIDVNNPLELTSYDESFMELNDLDLDHVADKNQPTIVLKQNRRVKVVKSKNERIDRVIQATTTKQVTQLLQQNNRKLGD